MMVLWYKSTEVYYGVKKRIVEKSLVDFSRLIVDFVGNTEVSFGHRVEMTFGKVDCFVCLVSRFS